MAGRRVQFPLAHLDAALGQTAPGAGIGLVILIGDDDGLARLQHLPKGLRQHIGVLGGRGAKAQLIARNSEDRGHARAGLIHFLSAKARGGVVRIGLHFALGVEPGQPVDHLPAGITATGVFEKRLTCKGRFGKGRKLCADKVEIEGHGTGLYL